HEEIQTEKKYHDRVAGAAARRVTIVDDDTFFLKRIEHLLAAENILLNSYSDSNQVLDAIEKFNPELVVLDVNMPGMNGFEVCSELRRKHEKLPIIVISADSSDETQAEATRCGAARFVAKPIKNMQFIGTIKDELCADD